MNKKAYIEPTTLVVRVATNCHICIGSPNGQKPTEGLDEQEPVPGGDDPGDFSRRRTVWDDEEEQNY